MQFLPGLVYFIILFFGDTMYHIIFNGDEKYIPYICVCITSIIQNTDKNISYKKLADTLLSGDAAVNAEEKYCFYILTDFLSEETINKINKLEKELNAVFPVSIVCQFLDDKLFIDFPQWRKSYSAYYRIMLAEFLPQEVKRALYLDGDTLVNTDIRAFMLQDLGEKKLAAVPNFTPLNHIIQSRVEKTAYSFSTQHCYFNSGVMLIDVENWRKENVQEKVMHFLNAYHVVCPDQDTLNAVFQERVKILPYQWNLMWHNLIDPEELKKEWKEHPMPFADETFYENLDCPKIIHFSVKPWASNGFRISKNCTPFYYPNIALWWDMAEKTPVFAKELLAIKESEPYQKMLKKNKRQELLLQYAWYRVLLRLKRYTRPFMRELEKPFKKIRDKRIKYKLTHK